MKPLNYRVYPNYGPLKKFSLVTSYKSALELYEKFRVSAYNPNTVAICVEMSDGFRKLLVTKEDVTKFEKEYICMQPKNRVEARIMRDLEEKRFRDEIPELMGKTFPEKEVDFHGEFGELTEAQQDQIINPKHYKILPVEAMKHFLDKGMEYMDIMRYALKRHTGVKAHVLGQVFKYAFRIGGKDDELQDAKKIAWYANRMVEEIQFERGETQNIPRGEYKE